MCKTDIVSLVQKTTHMVDHVLRQTYILSMYSIEHMEKINLKNIPNHDKISLCIRASTLSQVVHVALCQVLQQGFLVDYAHV